MMILNKLKWFGLGALVTGLALTSAGVLARQSSQAKADPTTATVKAATVQEEARSSVPEPHNGRLPDLRTRRIIAKLEEPVSMSFAAETPLGDVLKYIKQATTTPDFPGLPIYVDPRGLQEAERSLNSTIQIDLEGIPLRRTLQLVLSQLDLAYFVEDGMIVITSADSADVHLPVLRVRPSLLEEKMEQAEHGGLPLKEMEDLLKCVTTREALLKHNLYGCHGVTFGEGDPKDALLVEMRELIGLLKAERQAKKAPQAK